MKYLFFITFFYAVILTSACKQSSSTTASPVSDLAHIDVILDSVTWFAIKNDSFIQKEFGVMNIDTAHYGGKASYDIYVLGQLNFLHLSLAKDFWKNQQGGGVMTFQTWKPDMKDSLISSLQHFYTDSVYVHNYKGADFTLNEVMPPHKKDSSKVVEATIFPNLSTYSAEAYKNWGITDSIVNAGLSFQQFMADWGGEDLKNKLFHSISELHINANQKELNDLKSALLATGYSENSNNVFTHSSNPSVYITPGEEKDKPKYSKVKFRLTHSVAEKEIVFSPSATLKLSGNEAWFLFR
ncbi:MAG: hypothetical protein ABUT20_47510 [Bacteroidota bacterium]